MNRKSISSTNSTLDPHSTNTNAVYNPLRKWISLLLFVCNNCALIVGLRYAAVHSIPSNQVISSTEVLFAEILKFVFSAVACFVIDANCNVQQFLEQLRRGIIDDEIHNDLLKLSIPALLYTIQNNLQYVIESGTLFLVLYQFKIISTAVFYSTMLSRRISTKEWLTILFLAVGVGMVESSQSDILPHHASNIAGIFSVTVSIITSGYAGVFFEKILKDSKSSIWLINLQMSILSVIFALIACTTQDTEDIEKRGFLAGYNVFTVVVILLQALGGLVVALVVKYADNIHKGFATSMSIVLSSLLDSMIFDDVKLNASFSLGSVIVISATISFFSLSSTVPKGKVQVEVVEPLQQIGSPKGAPRGILSLLIGSLRQRWEAHSHDKVTTNGNSMVDITLPAVGKCDSDDSTGLRPEMNSEKAIWVV